MLFFNLLCVLNLFTECRQSTLFQIFFLHISTKKKEEKRKGHWNILSSLVGDSYLTLLLSVVLWDFLLAVGSTLIAKKVLLMRKLHFPVLASKIWTFLLFCLLRQEHQWMGHVPQHSAMIGLLFSGSNRMGVKRTDAEQYAFQWWMNECFVFLWALSDRITISY